MGEQKDSEGFYRSEQSNQMTLGDLVGISTKTDGNEVSHLRQENSDLLEVCKNLSETVRHLIKEK